MDMGLVVSVAPDATENAQNRFELAAAPIALARNGKPIVTTCVNGHDFTPENTRLRSNGSRTCIACANARNAQRVRAVPVDLPQDRAPYVDPNGALMLIAAVCRQALRDYRDGYTNPRHTDAAVWLMRVGLMTAEGQIDYHGYGRKEQV
jgi:hypothetical protein